jgi:hypothetical protein
MLELGFAEQTKEGLFQYTHPERIINIDETFLTLDEAAQPGWAGRPVSVFHNPTSARTGRAANKASITCTGLFGSTATGFVLPPHFQVKLTGNDETKRISTSIAATAPSRLPWILERVLSWGRRPTSRLICLQRASKRPMRRLICLQRASRASRASRSTRRKTPTTRQLPIGARPILPIACPIVPRAGPILQTPQWRLRGRIWRISNRTGICRLRNSKARTIWCVGYLLRWDTMVSTLTFTCQGSRLLRGRRHPRRLLTIESSASSCRKQVPQGKPYPHRGEALDLNRHPNYLGIEEAKEGKQRPGWYWQNSIRKANSMRRRRGHRA